MTTVNTVIKNDTTDADGTRSFDVKSFDGWRTGRVPAFIGLAKETGGFYVENTGGLTIEDALKRAGLDFTVALHEFHATVGDKQVPGPKRLRTVVGTWENGDQAALGVAGKGYRPVQPIQAAQFGQAVLDEGGANIVAAAKYGDPHGARMFLALKMPEGLMIGGNDPHDLYLTLGNSFNRETGLWGCVAPIRLACTNQTTATFYRAQHRFAIRHTGQMEYRITDVRQALDMTGTFAEQYAKAAEAMLAEPMGKTDVDAFLEKLLATPDTVKTERGEENWSAKRNAVRTIILNGENNEFGRGTRYAAYQGVTEWADHLKPAHSNAGRYARLVDGGETENLKVRAGALLMAGL